MVTHLTKQQRKKTTKGIFATFKKYVTSIIDVDYSSEIRCANPTCGQLICYGRVRKIEYKCPKCKQIYKHEEIA